MYVTGSRHWPPIRIIWRTLLKQTNKIPMARPQVGNFQCSSSSCPSSGATLDPTLFWSILYHGPPLWLTGPCLISESKSGLENLRMTSDFFGGRSVARAGPALNHRSAGPRPWEGEDLSPQYRWGVLAAGRRSGSCRAWPQSCQLGEHLVDAINGRREE